MICSCLFLIIIACARLVLNSEGFGCSESIWVVAGEPITCDASVITYNNNHFVKFGADLDAASKSGEVRVRCTSFCEAIDLC